MSLTRFFSYNLNISDGSIVASSNTNTVGSIFTTNGNVGIGITAPSVSLDVLGNSNFSGNVTIGSNVNINGPTLQIPSGNIAARPLTPQNGSIRYNSETQQFEGYGPGGAWGSLGGVIDIAQTTKILASETPSLTDGNLYFFTTGAERMRINSSGNIGIGTTVPTVLLDVAGSTRFTNSVITNSTITNLIGTNSTSTNSIITNLSTATLIASSGLTTNTALISNISGTNSTLTNLIGTNSTSTNSVITNSTITNLTLVNSSISSLSLSNSIDFSTVTQFSGSFAAANNVNIETDVTGFQLSNSVYGCFTSTLNVRITTSTGQLNSQVYMEGTQSSSGWLLNDSSFGDPTGISFTLTSSGQLQYTSTNQLNWISTTFTYLVNAIKLSSGLTQAITTTGNAIISGNLTILNTTDIGGSSTPSLSIAGGLSVTKRSLFSDSISAIATSNTIGPIFTTGGNVGIGTTTPNSNLVIYQRIDNNMGLSITNDHTGANTRVNLNFETNNNGGQIYISNVDPFIIRSYSQNTSGITLNVSSSIGSLKMNTSNITRMLISSSGNIGIGTTVPDYLLDVNGSARVNSDFFIGRGVSGVSLNLWDIPGAAWRINTGNFNFSIGNGTIGNTINTRMIIDSTGNVGIGTTSPVAPLHVQFSSGRAMIGGGGYPPFGAECTVNGAVGFLYNLSSTTPQGLNIYYNGVSNGGGSSYIWCNDATRLNFIVAGNGNVQNANNSYGAISDIKLKENITDTTPKLNDLLKVKIRNYNLIGDSIKQIGIIAQELEPIFPSLIEETKDMDKNNNDLGTTTKAIKYSVFIPILIKSIQEQQEIINELQSTINSLVSRIETLEKR